MSLNKTVTAQLDRLGATVQETARTSAREILVHDVQWPAGHFDASVAGFRERSPGYEDSTDEEIEEDIPPIYGLEFLQPGAGGFWEGWKSEFPQIDSNQTSPFASDDVYFYFLADHFRVPTDPLVYKLDHEETDSEPIDCAGMAVSEFLECLEPRAHAGE